MCRVQLDHVEPGLLAVARGLHERIAHRVHVGASHRARHLIARTPRHRAWRDHLPIVGIERYVHAFPAKLGRSLQAGMAKLQADLRAALRMDEIDDALPGLHLRFRVDAGAARSDAALRCHAGHLSEYKTRAAQRSRAEVHQVEVVRHAVVRTVGRHRRHHYAVRELHIAQSEWQEHRRERPVCRAAIGAGGKPALHSLQATRGRAGADFRG